MSYSQAFLTKDVFWAAEENTTFLDMIDRYYFSLMLSAVPGDFLLVKTPIDTWNKPFSVVPDNLTEVSFNSYVQHATNICKIISKS